MISSSSSSGRVVPLGRNRGLQEAVLRLAKRASRVILNNNVNNNKQKNNNDNNDNNNNNSLRLAKRCGLVYFILEA